MSRRRIYMGAMPIVFYNLIMGSIGAERIVSLDSGTTSVAADYLDGLVVAYGSIGKKGSVGFSQIYLVGNEQKFNSVEEMVIAAFKEHGFENLSTRTEYE